MGDKAGRKCSRSGAARGGGGGGGNGSSKPAAVIDLSSGSWGDDDDDDPFLDSLESSEQQYRTNKVPDIGGGGGGGGSSSSSSRRVKHMTSKTTGSAGSSKGGSGPAAGNARRRPAAPLTSISSLFAGGAVGNRATGATGASTPAPPTKLHAGAKRPRAISAAGQGRMKPPMPPPAAVSAASGRENPLQTRRIQRPLHPASAIGGGIGIGSGSGSNVVARGTASAWDGDGGLARGAGGGSGVVEDRLWPDKHRPRDVSGLAVHSKKVDEVRHWMTLALKARPGSEGACHLLALVGPPGSAKSTMVRLLAAEMDVELAEWQDTSGEGGPAYRPFADGPALVGERPRHPLGSGYQSAIDSFEEFMKRSSYRALPILAVKPAQPGAGAGGGKRRRIVLIEELPETYSDEKKARLRTLMAQCARSSPCPVIICWSQASESNSYQSRLEQVLSRETLRMPGVQITTCNPINATLLRQHLKGVLALEGVSDPKGARVQSAIATCAGDIRHALLNLQMSVGGGGGGLGFARRQPGGTPGQQTKRAASGRKKRGDAGLSRRSAAAGTGTGTGTGTGNGTGTGMRDTFLSQFHALGKLLYAKRTPPDAAAAAAAGGAGAAFARAAGGGWPPPSEVGGAGSGGGGGGERRGELAFVPEEVLGRGGMELDWALAFLQYHCVDFFTDEADLAKGLGYFSDADVFASRMFDSSRGYDGGGEQGVFPQRYAESIASRATASSNRHPAKSRMRAFGAPKSFEMRRSRTEAAGALRRFVLDAWAASGEDVDALWASSRHLKEAVDTDLLPTARLITGEWEAEAALRSLLQRFIQSRGEGQAAQPPLPLPPPSRHCQGGGAADGHAGVHGGDGPEPSTSWIAGSGAGFAGGAGATTGEGGACVEEEEDEIGDF